MHYRGTIANLWLDVASRCKPAGHGHVAVNPSKPVVVFAGGPSQPGVNRDGSAHSATMAQ